jgi:hypothetical protein
MHRSRRSRLSPKEGQGLYAHRSSKSPRTSEQRTTKEPAHERESIRLAFQRQTSRQDLLNKAISVSSDDEDDTAQSIVDKLRPEGKRKRSPSAQNEDHTEPVQKKLRPPMGNKPPQLSYSPGASSVRTKTVPTTTFPDKKIKQEKLEPNSGRFRPLYAATLEKMGNIDPGKPRAWCIYTIG